VGDAGIHGSGLSFREGLFEALNTHSRFAGANAQEAALPFVEHDELDFVPAGAETGQRLVKGVFDGFAACFG
jgi:hypothetical protein